MFTQSEIQAALRERVELEDARKREILELDAALDGLDHFAVLKIPPDAEGLEVKRAFHEASRRFHPDLFFKKELGTFRPRIERIFKRMSEAAAVLGDDARRTAYLRSNPNAGKAAPSDAPPDPMAEARAAERRARMARHPYLARTRAHTGQVEEARMLLAKGEVGQALSMLHQAAQVDPKSKEIQNLLIEARRRNDQTRSVTELKRGEEAEKVQDFVQACAAYRLAASLDPKNAVAAAKAAAALLDAGEDPKEARGLALRATELDGRNAEYRLLHARILLVAGQKKLAKRELELTLELAPENADAKAELRKLRWPF